MIVKSLRLSEIRADGGTQSRAGIDAGAVAEYTDAIRRGGKLPPPVVFYDGAVYWLADGFHRVKAHSEIGSEHLECEIVQGTRADAVWYSCGANQSHGLRRTNEDKRRAVETALKLKPSASDRAIAEHVGVSHDLVATVKREIAPRVVESTTQTKKGKDGKRQKVDPAKKSAAGKASAAKRKAAKAPGAEIPQSPAPDPFDSDDGRTHSEGDGCEEHVEDPVPSTPVPPPATPSASVLNARDRIVADAVALGPQHARWIVERILRHIGKVAA